MENLNRVRVAVMPTQLKFRQTVIVLEDKNALRSTESDEPTCKQSRRIESCCLTHTFSPTLIHSKRAESAYGTHSKASLIYVNERRTRKIYSKKATQFPFVIMSHGLTINNQATDNRLPIPTKRKAHDTCVDTAMQYVVHRTSLDWRRWQRMSVSQLLFVC